jgi:hypothetical protein
MGADLTNAFEASLSQLFYFFVTLLQVKTLSFYLLSSLGEN